MASSAMITGLVLPPNNAPKKTPKLMRRDEIEDLIAQGRHIIIIHQQVVKVDPWLQYHPGGDKAMLHMVGKDASDEIDA
jgi:delta8-fatty-acid desaturase